MKKFLSAIYAAALILMIPAIFIGYLYSNNTSNTEAPEVNQAKASSTVNIDESGFKPGLVFVLKGV